MGVRLRGFARQFATVASRIIPATPTNLRLITRGSENLFLGRRYWAQRDKDQLRDLSAYVGCVCKMGGELLSSVWALVLKEWALQQQDDAKCAIIIVAVLFFPNISVFGNFPQWWLLWLCWLFWIYNQQTFLIIWISFYNDENVGGSDIKIVLSCLVAVVRFTVLHI